MLFNLVLFNVCRYLLSPHYFYSLPVSAVLNHFGYPAPHLDQWQQCIWYDLGATQEILHQMRIRLSRGLPTTASPPRAESPPPSHRPAAAQICPNHGGNLLRPRKVRAQPPVLRALGPPRPWQLLLLERRKRKEGSTSLSSTLLPVKR